MAQPVLIQGGTFDPVHHGHLRSALDVADLLGIDQVRLLPCGDPPHRERPRANGMQRLQMLQAAIDGEVRFTIDERELRRAGPSYMVDTAASLRGELGDEPPICLMLGMDAFLGLPSWHQWQRLLGLINLVVMARPGFVALEEVDSEPLRAVLAGALVDSAQALLDAPFGKVLFVPVTQLDISATRIRAMVAEGKSPRYLLPGAVLSFIESEKLYKNEVG